MRNAKISDCHRFWRFNVMYNVKHAWYGFVLAHIKEKVVVCGTPMFVMETHDGCPILAEYSWLRAVPKKEGTPAKPKKIHQRGTKPWLSKFEYVDYDPKLIAPGVRVKCRDKKIRTVNEVDYDYIMFEGCPNSVDKQSGLGNYISKKHYYCDIMKILIEKKIDEPIHDRYNGYEVDKWHFWQGLSDKPPVDGDVKVEIWCRGNNTCPNSGDLYASGWYWKWDSHDSDIIAFRIAGDK